MYYSVYHPFVCHQNCIYKSLWFCVKCPYFPPIFFFTCLFQYRYDHAYVIGLYINVICNMMQGKIGILKIQVWGKELAWHSGCVIDCHTTTQGSIDGGVGAKTEVHVLRKGQQMGAPSPNDLTVDGTLNKTNQPTKYEGCITSTSRNHCIANWLLRHSIWNFALILI